MAELGTVGFHNPQDVLPPNGILHTLVPGMLFFQVKEEVCCLFYP
jgi:hypothetical protein